MSYSRLCDSVVKFLNVFWKNDCVFVLGGMCRNVYLSIVYNCYKN